ncbi:MAG: helix-turn-helix domain-containing protein [Ruminococcaceae bacterium]|nr:helix-turn-helix domain-containing protein [Oscillospiraceae bacterium]
MDKHRFVTEMDRQVKLVRTEYGFTQETMAKVLGLSKKTLVEIEKGRASLGWMGAVAFCSIFERSQVLAGLLGGEAEDMILALAFAEQKPTYPKTMGGKVWWRFVETCCGYKIQQNIISQHYRALDRENGRICSSFDLEEVRRELRELEGV